MSVDAVYTLYPHRHEWNTLNDASESVVTTSLLASARRRAGRPATRLEAPAVDRALELGHLSHSLASSRQASPRAFDSTRSPRGAMASSHATATVLAASHRAAAFRYQDVLAEAPPRTLAASALLQRSVTITEPHSPISSLHSPRHDPLKIGTNCGRHRNPMMLLLPPGPARFLPSFTAAQRSAASSALQDRDRPTYDPDRATHPARMDASRSRRKQAIQLHRRLEALERAQREVPRFGGGTTAIGDAHFGEDEHGGNGGGLASASALKEAPSTAELEKWFFYAAQEEDRQIRARQNCRQRQTWTPWLQAEEKEGYQPLFADSPTLMRSSLDSHSSSRRHQQQKQPAQSSHPPPAEEKRDDDTNVTSPPLSASANAMASIRSRHPSVTPRQQLPKANQQSDGADVQSQLANWKRTVVQQRAAAEDEQRARQEERRREADAQLRARMARETEQMYEAQQRQRELEAASAEERRQQRLKTEADRESRLAITRAQAAEYRARKIEEEALRAAEEERERACRYANAVEVARRIRAEEGVFGAASAAAAAAASATVSETNSSTIHGSSAAGTRSSSANGRSRLARQQSAASLGHSRTSSRSNLLHPQLLSSRAFTAMEGGSPDATKEL